jgi:hypothetical protein
MPGTQPLNVVLDTNVLVSGVITQNSSPQKVLDAWVEGRFNLVTSLVLINEFTHVLQYPRIAGRLQLSSDELDQLLVALLSQAHIVPGNLELPGVTRDPQDDPVVACAVEGKADLIVSGDQDLLILGTYHEVQILTPRQFLDCL